MQEFRGEIPGLHDAAMIRKALEVMHPMLQQSLIVGAGGFLGAVSRWLLTMAAVRFVPAYPEIGTTIANIAGAGCIGWLAGHGVSHGWLSVEWRLFLVTGYLGALTTFSTLVLETSYFARQSGLWQSVGHVALNLFLGFGLFILCERLGRG